MSRYLSCVGLLSLLLPLFVACSETGEKKSEAAAPAADDARVAAIQDALTETMTRWRYGDKSALYENEFPYLRDEHTLQDYLNHSTIKALEADSVAGITVKDAQLYGADSADVTAEILFVGPLGDSTRLTDTYRMYFYDGRWIKPTLSASIIQIQHEQIKRTADSAAEAEEKDTAW